MTPAGQLWLLMMGPVLVYGIAQDVVQLTSDPAAGLACMCVLALLGAALPQGDQS